MSREYAAGQSASEFEPDRHGKIERSEASEQVRGLISDAEILDCLCCEVALLDPSGRIIRVNEAWTNFAHLNGADAAGLGVGANYIEVCRRSAAESQEAERVLQGLQTLMTGHAEMFRVEYPCHAPDAQRWFQVCIMPSPVQGGAVVTHTDVTVPIAEHLKLQASEQHYRALIENEVDVVTILDESGRVKFESPAIKRILGYSTDDLVGRDVFELIHPSDVATVRRAFAEVLASDQPSRPLEFRFRHAEAGYRVLESIARRLPPNPVADGVIVNSRDITDRREVEAALRKQKIALKRSHQQLRALSGRLIGMADQERRRLSRELHDDLSQTLAALAVDMGALATASLGAAPNRIQAQLHQLQARVVEASSTVRKLAHQLHPAILDDLGITVALRSYCEQFQRREGIPIHFVHRKLEHNLSSDVASCIYRVTQEALRNVAKHAQATQIWVSAVGTPRKVILKIRDNGIGFTPEALGVGRGLGLISMAERSRLVNGSFRLTSSPQNGTILELRVPRQVKTPR